MAEAPSKTIWSTIKPFVNGGASGMLATCVIQPIDMVKVRIQIGAQGSPVRHPALFYRQCIVGLYQVSLHVCQLDICH